MTHPATAAAPAPHRQHGGDGGTRPLVPPPEPSVRWTAFTELCPPKDSDIDGHRSWLARSPWPEVVFASAR